MESYQVVALIIFLAIIIIANLRKAKVKAEAETKERKCQIDLVAVIISDCSKLYGSSINGPFIIPNHLMT